MLQIQIILLHEHRQKRDAEMLMCRFASLFLICWSADPFSITTITITVTVLFNNTPYCPLNKKKLWTPYRIMEGSMKGKLKQNSQLSPVSTKMQVDVSYTTIAFIGHYQLLL